MASAFRDPLAPSTCDQCGNTAEDTIPVKDNKSLCHDCFQDLPEGSREDIRDPEWICDKHFDRKVEVYCKTCKCGSCKDCAGDCINKSHDVVCVLQLEEEKRRYLWKLHKEVSAKVENLPRLQMEICNSMEKIKEDRIFIDRFFNEIKKEITRQKEDEIGGINSNIDSRIARLEMQRNVRLSLVNGHFECQRQTADEYHRRMENILLEDEERRRQKIQEAKARELDSQQALEATIEQIEKLLESTPEKLLLSEKQICQVSSLAKVCLEFQSKENVINDCNETEANIPNLKEKKDFDFYRFRPPPYLKYFLRFWLILYCVVSSIGGLRLKLMVGLIFMCALAAFVMLVFVFFLKAIDCCLLTIFHVIEKVLDIYTFQESLTKKLTIVRRHFWHDLMSFEITMISCALLASLYVLLVKKLGLQDFPFVYQDMPEARVIVLNNNL